MGLYGLKQDGVIWTERNRMGLYGLKQDGVIWTERNRTGQETHEGISVGHFLTDKMYEVYLSLFVSLERNSGARQCGELLSCSSQQLDVCSV
jgi:hypothetical protein